MNYLVLCSCVLSAIVTSVVATPQDSITPEELLNLLKDRDAQFDNANLHFRRSSQAKVEPVSSFDAFKSGKLLLDGNTMPEGDPVPEVIDYSYDQQMIVRGIEVTFSQSLLRSESTAGKSGSSMMQNQKWSNRGDSLKELTNDGTDLKYAKVLRINPKQLQVELIDEQRMEIEFAFGFGFGKRIKKISSINRVGNLWEVTGVIQIWWEDESTFRLTLDDDFIVRSATINCDVRGNLTLFDIETSKTAGKRFLFANNGSFVRTWMGSRRDGKITGEPKIVKQFEVEYLDVLWDLNDNKYRELTAIEADDNTQIMDRTGQHSPSHVQRVDSDWTINLIVANVVGLFVLLAVWMIRKFYRQKPGGPDRF